MIVNKNRPVFQLNSELHKVTGIQRVLMDIHEALRPLGAKIVGTLPFAEVNHDIGITEGDYIQMCGYGMFRHSVLIIHERRYLPIFWLWNKLLRLDACVVYVHHNNLYGQKLLSRFPEHIVAISDAGICNLTEYFGIPRTHITKIHNCMRQPDGFVPRCKDFAPERITILYPARINSVKRQVEIVRQLRGKLDHRIRILFAGIGPNYEELKAECKESGQFVALGYRNDVLELMQQSDFMMLYSHHEGLPISLIEAAMTGTPIICNAVGGNTEIAIDGKNAFVVNTWENLTHRLNSMISLSKSEYENMSKESLKVYDSHYKFEEFANSYQNLINYLSCQH